MSTKPPLPNRLLVEGKDEQFLMPQLLERLGLVWGEWNQRSLWPAEIVELGGIDQLLSKDTISTELKTPNLERLGIIVDADENIFGRWQRIRDEAGKVVSNIPDQIDPNGFVIHNPNEIRFGVWIMPDNINRGMLESFLLSTCLNINTNPMRYVQNYCDNVPRQEHSDFYKSATHRDKAIIHSWLAVQDPPGQQMHTAILAKTLQPNSATARPFLEWFCRLFEKPVP